MKKLLSNIFKSNTVKFLLLLLILSLTLFIANYSYISIKKSNDEKNEKSLLDSISKTKIWDTTFGRNGSGFDSIFLKTKYLDGKMFYRLWFDLNKENGIVKFDNTDNYVLYFADNDNFTLLEIPLDKSNAIKIIDSSEKFIAFRFEGNKSINKNVYIQFKSYNISSSD
jgi:hypothetical protein